jgi:PAS domain S-box-containing protein
MNVLPMKMSTYRTLLLGTAALVVLYILSAYSYLLFHSLAELFSIVVASCIFLIVWNTRDLLENNYLKFVGIAFAFVAGLDLFHTLAYKGMGVFPEHSGANLPTQLWIAARYIESLSLLMAPLFLERKLRTGWVIALLSLVFAMILGAIFYFNIFPDCYIEGIGLTEFKVYSEYLICLILAGALAGLIDNKDHFENEVLKLLIYSILAAMASELTFTFYFSVYSIVNFTGHILKIVSFYLLYKALIETALRKPLSVLFREINNEKEALSKANKLIAGILSSVNDGFFALDKDMVVTYFNKAAERLLGRKAEDILGRPLFEAFPEARGSIFEERYTKAIKNQEYDHFEVCFELAPYQNWYEVRVYPSLGGISVYFLVITEKKLAEQEKERLQEQLLHARKMESLTTLVGGIAHDFNNLLTVILGYSDILLSEKKKDNPDYEPLEKILQTAQKGAYLVRNLMAAGVILEPVPTQINLNHEVRTITEILSDSFQPNVKFKLNLDENLERINADASQIQQVLMNLALNSKEAMPDGGTIAISTGNLSVDNETAIELGIERPGSYVVLSVSDTGWGVDPQMLDKIFDPFFTTKGRDFRKGTGLGLSVVHGIVQKHGGHIVCIRNPGGGSTFKIYFPAIER